jgi:glycosyltransferase involved in cell wall biosynthesis
VGAGLEGIDGLDGLERIEKPNGLDGRKGLPTSSEHPSTASDPRVEALGFVDDLDAVYAGARCAVVPLLQGGGTPLKLIEALAHGLPVIATSRAAAGLELHDGEDCLLADDAPSFAAALVRVLREGSPELGARGRRLAAESYSVEALSELLAE